MTVIGQIVANRLFFSAGIVSATGALTYNIGYAAVSSCQLVSTGLYKLTWVQAHPLGSRFIVQLCGTDG